MRRRPFRPDSTEMLLDTMCNAFGGIILIALLVTLLVRETQRAEARDREADQAAELDRRRVQRAEAELEEALAEGVKLSAQTRDPAISNRLHRVALRDGLRQRVEDALETLDRRERHSTASGETNTERIEDMLGKLAADRRDLVAAVSEAGNRVGAKQARLEALRHRAESLDRQIQSMEEGRVRRFRLPREHDTGRAAWLLIVRYGKVYPVRVAMAHGTSRRNEASLIWTPQPNGDDKVHPRPDRGLPAAAAVAAWANLIGSVSSQDHYLAFLVYEDSFQAFLKVRDHAVRQGFSCGWEPLRNADPLFLTSHDRGRNPSPQ